MLEIRVLGRDGKIYAAPTLIYHYVVAHKYRPPQEFIDAVMTCEPDWCRHAKKPREKRIGIRGWLLNLLDKIDPPDDRMWPVDEKR
ncbi:MAG: hypothetical protein N3A38_10060 [Planctomycetota bacterium]|nr:hypothetical protein [Planctomycetota bacterium]